MAITPQPADEPLPDLQERRRKLQQNIKEKKTYSAPELTVHGDVEVITQQGGASLTDVPIGTPAPDVTT
jgi:hypothetical protein